MSFARTAARDPVRGRRRAIRGEKKKSSRTRLDSPGLTGGVSRKPASQERGQGAQS